MKTAFGIGLFVVLLIAIVYWAPRPASIPIDLQGKWATTDPRYADRRIDIGENLVALALGESRISVWFIERVEPRMTNTGKHYVLHLKDETGQPQSIVLRLDTETGNTLQLGRQREVIWHRLPSAD